MYARETTPPSYTFSGNFIEVLISKIQLTKDGTDRYVAHNMLWPRSFHNCGYFGYYDVEMTCINTGNYPYYLLSFTLVGTDSLQAFSPTCFSNTALQLNDVDTKSSTLNDTIPTCPQGAPYYNCVKCVPPPIRLEFVSSQWSSIDVPHNTAVYFVKFIVEEGVDCSADEDMVCTTASGCSLYGNTAPIGFAVSGSLYRFSGPFNTVRFYPNSTSQYVYQLPPNTLSVPAGIIMMRNDECHWREISSFRYGLCAEYSISHTMDGWIYTITLDHAVEQFGGGAPNSFGAQHPGTFWVKFRCLDADWQPFGINKMYYYDISNNWAGYINSIVSNTTIDNTYYVVAFPWCTTPNYWGGLADTLPPETLYITLESQCPAFDGLSFPLIRTTLLNSLGYVGHIFLDSDRIYLTATLQINTSGLPYSTSYYLNMYFTTNCNTLQAPLPSTVPAGVWAGEPTTPCNFNMNNPDENSPFRQSPVGFFIQSSHVFSPMLKPFVYTFFGNNFQPQYPQYYSGYWVFLNLCNNSNQMFTIAHISE